MATKRVGTSGRFGVRYGRKLRVRVADIEKKSKGKHKCPYCNKMQVKRIALGIWVCKNCDSKFTGKAYSI